ncbi:MAG: hypothetical protein HY700_05840 [Gemmatimonadetes bacterium]|nr:hypothetical protein [Gemmatimonadota bacterium]
MRSLKSSTLPLDPRLFDASRIGRVGGRLTASWLDLTALGAAGAAAALLTNAVRLRLGIPGSNIVLVAFPMALGLALVPRRGAGALMGAAALATTAMMGLAGVRLAGVGAQTSLLLTGPLLDLALSHARRGWQRYGAIMLACAAANAAAFWVRGAAKLMGLPGGGRPFDRWWLQAIATYAAAGLVAGLISAIACFHFRERTSRSR